MSRIVPKLNLNKTPQIVENNSLMFSKNIKLLTDNTFTNDSSIENIISDNSTLGVVIGYIVGVNSKIYFFVNDDNVYKIKEYDEITKTISIIDCAWTYSGGKITGCVTVNNSGEYILTIAEYFDNEDLNLENNVPIKHINLSPNRCSSNDDESIYTQHPNLPITNLKLVGYYNNAIPAGVYQFFIRYKIRKDFYTSWMPCSNELFVVKQNKINTVQGSILYNDITKESNKSFVFETENLIPTNLGIYKEFQLGFIISRDNGSFARSWKHFEIDITQPISKILFDYNDEDVEEINIEDLISSNYELFNVKNVISYKNKLFVSNYKETNFNDNKNCKEFAKAIDIKINCKSISNSNQEYYCGDYLVEKNDQTQLFTHVYINEERQKIGTETRQLFNIEQTGSGISTQHTSIIPMTRKYIIKNLFFKLNSLDVQIIDENGIDYETEEGYIQWFKTNITDKIQGINNDGDIILEYNNVNYIYSGCSYETFIVYVENPFHYITEDLGYIVHPKYNVEQRGESIENEDFQTLMPFTNYDFYCHFVKEDGIITNGFLIDTKKIKRYVTLNILYDGTYYDINDLSSTGIKGLYRECTAAHIDPDTEQEVIPQNVSEDAFKNKYTINDLLLRDELNVPNKLYGFIPTSQEHGTPSVGVIINTIQLNELSKDCILYPSFYPKIQIPNGYIGYFISMYKYNNNVSQCFNIRQKTITGGDYNYNYKVDSLEHDTILFNSIENIKIKNNYGSLITNEAKYMSSGVTNPLDAFGCLGYIEFYSDENISSDSILWTIGNENSFGEANKVLIKVTPFIYNNSSYTTYKELNLQGYFCKVNKLTDNTYYISDDKAYTKDTSNNRFYIEEYKSELNTIQTSETNIHSNFNLSCISLTEELFPKIRTYEETINEGTNEETTITKSQVIFAVNSLIASYIFKLEETFKTYVRRTYSEYNEDNLVVFNNTIRSSNIDVDETYRNIYRFDATDYYNVPTNRGIIINLFSILNNIYIHTEHSLFKFVDNKQLASEDGNVLLQESNVFDTGIQEVFDAQYGHGGLYKKEHSLINYEYYIFYDKLAKTIYAYNGENDLVIISDPIKKLMKHFDADDILFAGDNYNDRFFINLRKTRTIDNVETIENVCLSYNLKAKSFISIHDIDFDESFNSRINTYFLQQGIPTNVFKIDNDSALEITNYSGVFKSSYLKCSDIDSYNEANNVASCIDIIYNQDYEIVKNLDYINWICRAIENYADNDYNLAEEIGSKYSGTAVRIYTDETKSEIIPLVDNNGIPLEANTHSINTPESYQYPRYNCGIWSLNYFRDVKNRTDDFHYNEKVPLPNARALYQEDSLLYGKYFIVRFIFKNKNFKLENIKLSLKNYGKA